MNARLASSPHLDRQRPAVSASSERLLVMLYDGACSFLAQGAAAMRAGDARAAHIKLGRAEAIISHLANTLDMEQGDIPRNLLSIFLFCARHLNRARVERNPRKIEDVIKVLVQVRDAWAGISPG
jgi:flagellar protein FliS